MARTGQATKIYKNGLRPDSLRGTIVTRSQISSYLIRNQLDIDIPRGNLESPKGSFFYSGAKTWNQTPIHIRMSPTISALKRTLKAFLHR